MSEIETLKAQLAEFKANEAKLKAQIDAAKVAEAGVKVVSGGKDGKSRYLAIPGGCRGGDAWLPLGKDDADGRNKARTTADMLARFLGQ